MEFPQTATFTDLKVLRIMIDDPFLLLSAQNRFIETTGYNLVEYEVKPIAYLANTVSWLAYCYPLNSARWQFWYDLARSLTEQQQAGFEFAYVCASPALENANLKYQQLQLYPAHVRQPNE